MTAFDAILMQLDREFKGRTFNGKSLMETCRALSPEEARSTDTYEGFTAWDNLVHCLYFKYDMLRALGDSSPVEPYPWPEGSFPSIADTSETAWAVALDYADKLHEAFMTMLRGLDQKRLEETSERWECTWWEFLLWILTHDSYHVAQIRNMGIPSLRKARKQG